MDAVLQRDQLVEIPEPEADDVVGLAEALARCPTERAATRFTEAVERMTPGDTSSRTLWQVSELIGSVSKTDVDGRTGLEVVVTKWLSFGYPWALEVPPEALAHVRRRDAETRSSPSAVFTLVASVVSAGWYLLLLTSATVGSRRSGEGVDTASLVLGGGALLCLGWLFEIVRTMATAKLDEREDIERTARRLQALGRLMWAAPVAMALAAPFDGAASILLGLLVGPLSVSCAGARLAARRLRRG
jgi:hypothetical protein